ncbi:MAG: hypothetical protein CMK06_09570 [Ponticaulis sp.]|nr:hypothetical protein [Ponticaulis sp.]|tara:strand:+ start:1703 stop:2011 length:309 start_codon:yes stop_codon:yes gene_type:complete
MNRYVMLIGFLIAAFLAVGLFQAKSGAGESHKRIRELKRDIVDIQGDIDQLEKKFDALASEARIAELATERLGMQPARARQMISLETAEAHFGELQNWEGDE